MLRTVVTALLCTSLPAAAGAGEPPEPTTIDYRIKPNDTLVAIARRGLKRPQDYVALQRFNHVRDDRALRPGSVIRLPIRLLRTVPIGAKVIAVRGQASVGGEAAKIGGTVREGQLLTTAANAFLSIELADGSLLTLPSRSRMLVARLHRVVLTDGQMKSFRLLGGRVETEVEPVAAGGRFEIRTPVSVAAVRGTRFRVSVPEVADASGTGVISGLVGVEAAAGEVVVPEGQGVIATSAGPAGPVPLLPKPGLVEPGRLQDEEQVAFRVTPVAGAVSYRLQLAGDAGFVDVLAETDSAGPLVTFAEVPNGSQFVRATALSPEGLEGLPAVFSFERRQNNLKVEAGAPPACPAARCLRFKWRAGGEGVRRFRFQLARERDGAPMIDLAELRGTELTLTDLAGGKYRWRVQSSLLAEGKRQSKWLDWQELEVAPETPR